jgi:tyrosinase
MLQIAGKYSNEQRRSEYLKAVEKFRLPFWDYHRPRNYNADSTGITNKNQTTSFPYDFSVPQIFTLTDINVRMYPDDKLVSKANPLHHFRFPDRKGQTEAMTTADWSLSRIEVS